MNAIIYCETISQDTQSGDYFSECEIHLEIEGDDFEDLLHSIKNAYIYVGQSGVQAIPEMETGL